MLTVTYTSSTVPLIYPATQWMYKPKFILILSLIELVNCSISAGIKTSTNDPVQRQIL